MLSDQERADRALMAWFRAERLLDRQLVSVTRRRRLHADVTDAAGGGRAERALRGVRWADRVVHERGRPGGPAAGGGGGGAAPAGAHPGAVRRGAGRYSQNRLWLRLRLRVGAVQGPVDRSYLRHDPERQRATWGR